MKETLRALVRMTALDAELRDLAERIDRIPKIRKELDAAEKKAKARVERLAAEHAKARDAERKAELEVKALREKLDKFRLQQTQVKTNKEFEAMTHEIDAARAKIDEADTAGLEALEREETAAREKAEAERELAALLAENVAERERLAEQEKTKTARLEELEDERDRRADELPQAIRSEYELLERKFPGGAVVPVEGTACGGCGMNLTPQNSRVAHQADKIVRCEGCSRILFDREALGAC